MAMPDPKESGWPASVERPVFLFGEGKNDTGLLRAATKSLGLEGHVDLYPPPEEEEPYGKDKLSRDIKMLPPLVERSPNLRAIGIARDWDTDPPDRREFKSVAKALKEANLPVPDEPEILVVGNFKGDATRPIKIGVFMFPAKDKGGKLEHLCLRAFQDRDPAYDCVGEFFACVKKQRNREPSDKDKPKSEVQCLLASYIPGLGIGSAANKDFWPWKSQVWDPLKAFIKELCERV